MQNTGAVDSDLTLICPQHNDILLTLKPGAASFNYLGVKVIPYDPQYESTTGIATFKVDGKLYASKLEWYGPAYGFTAQSFNLMPFQERSPEALGRTILDRMRAAAGRYLAVHSKLTHLMLGRRGWESALCKTILYLHRHTAEMQAPLPNGIPCVKIKKASANNSSVQNLDSPGFTLVKTSAGRLYVRIKVLFLLTEAKIILWELELSSNTLYLRKKIKILESKRPHRWQYEVAFTERLIKAKADGIIDLTGLFVPFDVVDNQIIEEKEVNDVLNEVNLGNLTLKDKVQIAYDVSRGLFTLHTVFRVAHRDIKPENVLLCRDRRFRIFDYELICDSPDFNNGLDLYGSHDYIAPEFMDIRNAIRRAKHTGGPVPYTADSRLLDAWLLGMLLYIVFTRGTPSFFKWDRDAVFFTLVDTFRNSELRSRNEIPPEIKQILYELFEPVWQSRLTVVASFARISQLKQAYSLSK